MWVRLKSWCMGMEETKGKPRENPLGQHTAIKPFYLLVLVLSLVTLLVTAACRQCDTYPGG